MITPRRLNLENIPLTFVLMCRWEHLGQVVGRSVTVSMPMVAKLPLASATVSQVGGVSI